MLAGSAPRPRCHRSSWPPTVSSARSRRPTGRLPMPRGPFDRARDGFVIGEGAGVLYLEERERALARGARILAEVVGYASNCDAGHLTAASIRSAKAPQLRSGLRSPTAGDRRPGAGRMRQRPHAAPRRRSATAPRARAIAASGLGGAAVSSTKALHGHTLGAAGGVEAVAALMALVRDNAFRRAGTSTTRSRSPQLDYMRAPRRAVATDAVVSNSFGFGGHNARARLRPRVAVFLGRALSARRWARRGAAPGPPT